MPKRGCPWPDSAPLQLKTRVTQKEVNEGVARDTNMTAVYERTKSLLFSGARSLKCTKLSLSPESCNVGDPPAGPLQGSARGQMKLGPEGKLLKSPPEKTETPFSPPGCALCTRAGSSAPCVRCEKAACRSCWRRCSLCQRDHCFLCCAPNYDERDERLICVDCPAL
ncbi:apoptosis regulatory protein Siva-like [Polyodon spathula]|uniref:apoptosis regulatory protein Siva-like n=1 Tax=Polyodon spathula TaxID=7913 RepID=UPI001B7F3CE5|nr:apoptosis regulatory protein Siva-like [Polyodon spathula]